MHHQYRTHNTCSTRISFDLDGDVVHNVQFENGCNGNLQAMGKLVEGMKVQEIAEKLEGIHCGLRPTSCADQLCQAVRQAYEEQKGNSICKNPR